MRQVCVQALDGRWNYGPVTLEAALRSEEFGTYETIWQAKDAMIAEADKAFAAAIAKENAENRYAEHMLRRDQAERLEGTHGR